MKRFLKSYLVFTSLMYRIVMFIVVPIVMIGAAFLVGIVIMDMGTEPEEASCIVVLMFLPMVEIVSDSWIFGGIQSKDAEKLDYLKTSGAGMNVFRTAIVIDLLRKLILTVGIMGITYCMFRTYRDANSPVLAALYPEDLIYFDHGGFIFADEYSYIHENFIDTVDWGSLLCTVLISYFFSVAGTMLSRFGSTFALNCLITYLLEILIAVFMWGTGLKFNAAFIIPFVILDVAISIMAVRIAMKKVEGSYYDK